MPFRCKCGRTFEKPDTFSSHTSSCALFHHRRVSSSYTPPSSPTSSTLASLDISRAQGFALKPEIPSPPPLHPSSPTAMDYPAFMPTALSIQNAFEGVRRRSLSYNAFSK